MRNSAPIFANYLLENRFNAKYERCIGDVNPDFSVWQDETTPFAFWDVADREFTAVDQAEADRMIAWMEQGLPMEVVGGPTRGYRFVRAKIKSKFKQFKKAAPVPGMLVLAEWTGRADIDPTIMAAALYGWPQIIIPRNQPNPVVLLGRTDDGKMVDQKVAEDNKNFSAIGILYSRPINWYVFGLDRFAKDLMEKFDDREHILGLFGREERRQRAMGIDLDLKSNVLDIYLVKDAHQPWPKEVCGKHDRVYSYDEVTAQYNLARDGLAARIPLEIPASVNQRMLWDIAAHGGLRND